MRKVMAGVAALLLAQSGLAETLITAQDYAVDSDVVLESAVREIKAVPQDTVNVAGDAVKFAADETVTAVQGAAAVFKADPINQAEKAGMVEVANAWDSSNDILFRSYKVTAEVGKSLTQGADVPPGAAVDASGFFAGIDFPEGASVWYRPELNRLFIRNTLANILAMEDVLAEQHSAVRDLMGKQVEIETKFVEVNQKTLNELGFNWTFVSKYDGAAHIADDVWLPAPQELFSAGLRSIAGADTLNIVKSAGSLRWDLVITALEQSDDADVLSAPRIVTRDGNKATIIVGEQRAVSSGFEVKNSESSLFVEHELDSQVMGVQLEVTPAIRKDSLLDLKLKPKVIDLLGYDNYQATPDNATMSPLQGGSGFSTQTAFPRFLYAFPFRRSSNTAEFGVELPVPMLEAQLPYYRLREIETQVTVADGSTVGMGGLIYDKLETYKDKVPVLGSIPLIGRLFRSEGERSIKRNLMIFVTATQVDVNGRRAADLALKK